jgi:hypothetical protein
MSHQKLLVKDKAKQAWKMKSKTTELMRHSATNCLLQLYTQVF